MHLLAQFFWCFGRCVFDFGVFELRFSCHRFLIIRLVLRHDMALLPASAPGTFFVFPADYGLTGLVSGAGLVALLDMEREKEVAHVVFMDTGPRVFQISGFTSVGLLAGAENMANASSGNSGSGLPEYPSSSDEDGGEAGATGATGGGKADAKDAPAAAIVAASSAASGADAIKDGGAGDKHGRASEAGLVFGGVPKKVLNAGAAAFGGGAQWVGADEEDMMGVVDDAPMKEAFMVIPSDCIGHFFFKVGGKEAVAGTAGAVFRLRLELFPLGAELALISYNDKKEGLASSVARLHQGVRPAHVPASKVIRYALLRASTTEFLSRAMAVVSKHSIGTEQKDPRKGPSRNWLGWLVGNGKGSEQGAAALLVLMNQGLPFADDMRMYARSGQGARADLLVDASEMGASVIVVDGTALGCAMLSAQLGRDGLVGDPTGLSGLERNRQMLNFTM